MSIFSHILHFFSKHSAKKGFTLIELLVVMSIMVVVTGAMLLQQSKFNSATILRSLAYSVALSMRQAQVYGTSVFGTSAAQANCTGGFYATNTGSCFASAYGLYFNSSSPTQYILFADLNSNSRYDAGENVKVFTLGTGYAISRFCATGTNGGGAVSRCSPSTISSVSVVFKRPNPDAQFTALNGSGNPIAGDLYSSVKVEIQNLADTATVRSAVVTTTGLISAQ